MSVTLKEVAKKAKVSTASVSYVLNKKNLTSVSEKKRKQILQAIRELGYRPHAGARAMANTRAEVKKQFGTVGLFFGNSSVSAFEANSNLITSTNYTLSAKNYNMLFYLDTTGQQSVNTMPRMFSERNIDGIIALSDILPESVQQIKEMNIPAIFVNTSYWDEVDCIKPDNLGGMYNATKYLIELGHKKFLYLQPGWVAEEEIHPSVLECYQGFLRALDEAGLEQPPPFKIPKFDKVHEQGELLEEYLTVFSQKDFPTAVVAYSMGYLLPVCFALEHLGLKRGVDVSLIGGGEASQRYYPLFDCVHIPMREIGIRAAELIMRKIEKNEPLPSEIVSEKLELGNTTGPPRNP